MREWIKLKSIPKIAFAHTYSAEDGFENQSIREFKRTGWNNPAKEAKK